MSSSSKLSDNIEKDSVFWVKWEMEDENGKKFIPPVFVYYKAEATGERIHGNFQIRYEDGLLNWVPIGTVNASSQKIVSADKFDEEKGWPIATARPEPRIGPEFQAIIASGPHNAQTEFQKRALKLVPLTNEEIMEDDKKFESNAAVAEEFKRTRGEKKGKGGRRKKTRKRKGGVKITKPPSNLKPVKVTEEQRKRWKKIMEKGKRKELTSRDMIIKATLRNTTPSRETREKATSSLLSKLSVNKGGKRRLKKTRKKRKRKRRKTKRQRRKTKKRR